MQTNEQMQRCNPFQEESQIEPSNSVGSRHRGNVVGWLITHQITGNTIRYTQMYVDPRSQLPRCNMLLLAKAIQLQVKHAPNTKATVQIDIDNTSMIRFLHRRLKPYLDEVRTIWATTKVLS